jgi:hypothetical protein
MLDKMTVNLTVEAQQYDMHIEAKQRLTKAGNN